MLRTFRAVGMSPENIWQQVQKAAEKITWTLFRQTQTHDVWQFKIDL